MPHFRERYLKALLKRDMRWSRVVSVMGMRQAGKTTLLKGLAETYLTLDDADVLSGFQKGEWSLLDLVKPLAVDEAQLLPALFPQIKLRVDERQAPGQYLLTGSVRFLSRRQIRESLTGRTSVLELLPMTLAECCSRPLKDSLAWALSLTPERLLERLERERWASPGQIEHYLATGGMPGICFRRDASIRSRMWAAHLDTVLSRDLRLVRATEVPLLRLRELYSELARMQGQPLNASRLARILGVSAPTAKSLIGAMEALFLVRPHGKSYFCEDVGLGCHALGGLERVSERQRVILFAYHELRAQLNYLHDPRARLTEFKTRGGAYVPFVVDLPGARTLGVTCDSGPLASEKSMQSLTAFRKRHRSAAVLALHQGERGYRASNGVPCIPWTWLA